MFNSLEKAKELLEHFKGYGTEIYTEEYTIKIFELISICEDYIMAQQCCDAMSMEIESLKNYIRLLEKENRELHEQK